MSDYLKSASSAGERGRFQFEHPSGLIRYVQVSSLPAMLEGSPGLCHMLTDVTDEQREQAILKLLQNIQRMELNGTPKREVLAFACNSLAEIFHCPFVWITLKDTDGTLSIRAQSDACAPLSQGLLPRWVGTEAGAEPTGMAARSGEPQVRQHPSDTVKNLGGPIEPLPLNHFCAVPLIAENEVIGALSLCSVERAFCTHVTMGQLLNCAGQIAEIILAARLQEQVRIQSVALASAANAVVITDPQGRIQWVNPAWSKLYGYDRSEAAGATPRILNSGAQSREFYREMWGTIQSGRTWRGELQNRTKSAGRVTVELTISPVRDSGGQVSHFIG